MSTGFRYTTATRSFRADCPAIPRRYHFHRNTRLKHARPTRNFLAFHQALNDIPTSLLAPCFRCRAAAGVG